MHKHSAVMLVVGLGASALAIGASARPSDSDSAKQHSVSVRAVTWNVRYGSMASVEQVGEVLRTSRADVAFLSEVPHGDWALRVAKSAGMVHVLNGTISSANHPDKFKVILSRTPISSGCEVHFDSEGAWNPASAVRGRTRVRGVPIALWSTHIANREGKGHAWTLANALSRDRTPNVLVGGDLNLYVDSPGLQAIRHKGFVSAWDLPHANPQQQSTIVGRPDHGVIDHVLLKSRRGSFQDVNVVNQDPALSDHYPVNSTVRLRPTPKTANTGFTCPPLRLPSAMATTP